VAKADALQPIKTGWVVLSNRLVLAPMTGITDYPFAQAVLPPRQFTSPFWLLLLVHDSASR